MEAGRKLDVLIVEKIFNYEWGTVGNKYIIKSPGGCVTYGCKRLHQKNMPNYSTDIADTWKLVEYMDKHCVHGILNLVGPQDDCSDWCAQFTKKWQTYDRCYEWPGKAKTPQEAICLAALYVFDQYERIEHENSSNK